MQTQENMRAYIEKTNITNILRYSFNSDDFDVIYEMICRNDLLGALCLLFEYGRAKGYRLAKSELRRG